MPASASTPVPYASASPTVMKSLQSEAIGENSSAENVQHFRGQSDCSGLECVSPLLGGQCLGELVQLAFQDAIEIVHGQLYAVVGDAVLRIVVGADLLRTLAGADLRPTCRRLLGRLLLALELVEPRPQHAQGLRLVLELRLLVL